jgi:hypothetical protein
VADEAEAEEEVEEEAEAEVVVTDGAPAARDAVDVEAPASNGDARVFGGVSVSASMLLPLWGFAVLAFLMLVQVRHFASMLLPLWSFAVLAFLMLVQVRLFAAAGFYR